MDASNTRTKRLLNRNTIGSMPFEIDICNRHDDNAVDLSALRAAVEHVLREEAVESAVISVTIVDNSAIHAINKEHLQHDYPTDVISFQLDWTSSAFDVPPLSADSRSAGASIEGEIVVSYDYAQQNAAEGNWSTADEVTLYVIHGLLHICGYDDLSVAEKRIMRQRERSVLAGLGLHPVYPADDSPADVQAISESPGGDS